MLTFAVACLFVAIIAGVFGMMLAGPLGPILFLVFMVLFVGSLGMYLRNRRLPPPE